MDMKCHPYDFGNRVRDVLPNSSDAVIKAIISLFLVVTSFILSIINTIDMFLS